MCGWVDGWIDGQMSHNTKVLSFNYKEDCHWRIALLCHSLSEQHLPSIMLPKTKTWVPL